jgi:hypothetical protein
MKTLTIIIGIFAVLMGFLTVSAVYQEAFSQSQEGASLDVCRNSVLLRDQATISTVSEEFEKITPLQCPTEDVDPDGITRDEERERISDLMSQCWYMFAEGRTEDIFQAEPTKRTCHVCYQYLPDNDGISREDLQNYLQSTTVDPTSYRTVNSGSHLGDGVDLDSLPPISSSTTIELDSIAAPDAITFVDDPGNHVTDPQEQTINDNLRDVFTEANITGNVVIADKINGLSRGGVHNTMQRVGLVDQENTTTGFYLTVSLEDKRARLDLTPDLRTTIPEQSIGMLLQPLQNTRSTDGVGEALVDVSANLKERFTEDQDLAVQRGSYYEYLTQGGTGFYLPESFDDETPYGIAYVSPSNDQAGFLQAGYFSNNDLEVVPNNYITVEPYDKLLDRCDTVRS